MFIHTYTYTCIHIHVCIHYTDIHSCARAYYIDIHAYTCVYTCICIHIDYIHIYITHICMYIHIHMYTYTCIHIHIHTHLHTHTRNRAVKRLKQKDCKFGASLGCRVKPYFKKGGGERKLNCFPVTVPAW